MEIYVVRHTETNSNKEGIAGDIHEDINETGIQQALELRKQVEGLEFDLIISSPSIRTKHVTKIINNDNQVAVIYDDRLIERDLGIYEYSKYEDIDKFDFWNYYPKKYIKLELMEDLYLRVRMLIEEIKLKYANKKILVVTHGGITRGFYCYQNGVPVNGDLSRVGHKNGELRKYII